MGHLYGQLSQTERLDIYRYRRLGWSIRRIGRHQIALCGDNKVLVGFPWRA